MIICIPCHLCKKKSRSEKGTSMLLFLLLDNFVYHCCFSRLPYCCWSKAWQNYKFYWLDLIAGSLRLGECQLGERRLVLGTSDLFDHLLELFPFLCAWVTIPIKEVRLFFLGKFLMDRIIADHQIWFLRQRIMGHRSMRGIHQAVLDPKLLRFSVFRMDRERDRLFIFDKNNSQ